MNKDSPKKNPKTAVRVYIPHGLSDEFKQSGSGCQAVCRLFQACYIQNVMHRFRDGKSTYGLFKRTGSVMQFKSKN